MDEASKATPPELVLPLTLGKKVVVIGDHKQLPPMIDSDEFAEALGTMGAKQLAEELSAEELKVSQFEKLFSHAPEYAITSLDTQFRMHEQIMKCISQFYADQKELEHGLICGIKETQDIPDLNDKASRWHGLSLLPFLEPDIHAIWVNVDTPEQQRKNSTSYYNLGEVEAIQTVLRALTKADGFSEYMQAQKKEEDKEIGVITYYMSQMRAIRNALYPSLDKNQWRNFERFKCDNEYSIPFRINTVDRFQGMERNIVIVSTVRSNKYERPNGDVVANKKYPTALGFAKELQRINVGFSRAKRLLIVVGNKEHFAHKPEYANAISQMKYIDISQLQNL
jgi:superfamily I DNA and/or RNA helicase